MTSKTVQWIIVASIFLVFLAMGIMCYFKSKDSFTLQPEINLPLPPEVPPEQKGRPTISYKRAMKPCKDFCYSDGVECALCRHYYHNRWSGVF